MNKIKEVLSLYKSINLNPFYAKNAMGNRPDRNIEKSCTPILKSDELYHKYEKEISHNLDLIASITNEDLIEIVNELNDNTKFLTSGLFFSALFNLSGLSKIECRFDGDKVGYKLYKGKKITVLEGSKIDRLGFASEGDIINYSKHRFMSMAERSTKGTYINYGVCGRLGEHSNGGIIINVGEAESVASEVTSGMQFNIGYCTSLANEVKGGMQINWGLLGKNSHDHNFATRSNGGVQINFGSIGGSFGHWSEGGVQINFGEVYGYYDEDRYMWCLWGMGMDAKSIPINVGFVSDEELYDHLINFGYIIYPKEIGGKRRTNSILAVGSLGTSSELEKMLYQLSKWKKLGNNPQEAIKVLENLDYIKLEDNLKRATKLYQNDLQRK